MRLLEKKKNNRPLIIDLIDYFSANITSIPGGNIFNLNINPKDFENYQSYTKVSRQAYEKKRLIESN